MLNFAGLRVDIHRMEAYFNNQLISLTGTEFRILLIFMENPGQGILPPADPGKDLWRHV